MPDFVRTTASTFIKRLVPVASLAIIMTPSVSGAEPFLLLRNEIANYPEPVLIRQTVKRPVDISISETGDLVIRHRVAALTVAYNPPDDFVEPQERIRIAQRQDCPSISGISLKISFMF